MPVCLSKGLNEMGGGAMWVSGGRAFRVRVLPVQRPWVRSVLVPGTGRRPRQRGNRARDLAGVLGHSEDLVFSFEWQEAGEGLEQRRELISVFTGSLWLHMGNRRGWGGVAARAEARRGGIRWEM